jgi:hypothetical protein
MIYFLFGSAVRKLSTLHAGVGVSGINFTFRPLGKSFDLQQIFQETEPNKFESSQHKSKRNKLTQANHSLITTDF